jgi:hypothetical protein
MGVMEICGRFGAAVVFSTAAVLSIVGAVQAAQIEVLASEGATECHMSLSGNIELGDLQALEAARKKTNANPSVLCLESQAGSYSEALRIVRQMLTKFPTIATRIEAGARCHGPCGLIFLAGRGRGSDGQWPSRTLHVRGELVLQAPPPPKSLLSRSRKEAAQIYQRGRSDVAKLIKLFDKIGGTRFNPIKQRWVRPSLFYNLIELGPTRTLAIDTVGKAGNWNIEVSGVGWPSMITDKMYKTACFNHYAWNLDEFDGKAEFEVKQIKDDGNGLSSWEIIHGGTGGPICSIRHPNPGEPGDSLDGKITADDPSLAGVGFRISVGPWQLFPLGAKLKSL